MRFPLPVRFSAKQITIVSTLFLICQMAEGTNPTFALLTFIYIILSANAFNAAGGIFFPSGSFIFFNSILSCLLGLTWKICLFEPGDKNLKQPTLLMLVYCTGMGAMGLVAYINSLVRPKRALITGMEGEQLNRSAVGCMVFGGIALLLSRNASNESASFSSALAQINRFTQLAVILATVYAIQKSGGRKSTNWVVWLSGAGMFLFGALNFSKEGMFLPMTTWLVTAISISFDFKRKHLLVIGAGAFLTFYYLVPYSQYGRQSREANGANRTQALAAIGYLENLGEVRKFYEEGELIQAYGEGPHLYDTSQGLFDRLETLAYDDSLIDVTEQGHVFGLVPTIINYENIVPRFIWHNKPYSGAGNDYGHELGVLGDDDVSTGISFSPLGDAYHEAKWVGMLVVLPIVMFLLFFISDSLTGDVRQSPFGLLFVALFSIYAAEGLLGGSIYLQTIGAESILIVALLAKYVMPIFSTVLLGTQRSRVQRTRVFPIVLRPRRLREGLNETTPEANTP